MKLNSYVPALSNYPTSGDFPCEPYRATSAGRPWTIDIPNGTSHSRSWGKASGHTEVILNTQNQICLLVWWTGKAPGGQSYRHIVRRNGGWKRVIWTQLSHAEQILALDASRPTWANVPGKLREERASPPVREDLYKLVVVDNDNYRSLYSADIVYRLGSTLTEAAREDHRGGFYAYDVDLPHMGHIQITGHFRDLLLNGNLVPSGCIPATGTQMAVIRVRTRGKHIAYSGGKVAASQITPLTEVARFTL